MLVLVIVVIFWTLTESQRVTIPLKEAFRLLPTTMLPLIASNAFWILLRTRPQNNISVHTQWLDVVEKISLGGLLKVEEISLDHGSAGA